MGYLASQRNDAGAASGDNGDTATAKRSFMESIKRRFSSSSPSSASEKDSHGLEVDTKSPRSLLKKPLTYTWLKKKVSIRRKGRKAGHIPDHAYKGESLAGYYVDPNVQGTKRENTEKSVEEKRRAMEAEVSFHSMFLFDGDECEPDPLCTIIPGSSSSVPSSSSSSSPSPPPPPLSGDEAISCSKTDFGHFTKVLDEPYGNALRSMWDLPERSGSRQGMITSVRTSSRNSARSLSDDGSDVCSPSSENSADCVLDQQMTLRDVRKMLREASAGDVIDLGGNHIAGSGSITISVEDVTLQNGRLDLSGGLTIKAKGVMLVNLEIQSSSSKGHAVKIVGNDCSVSYCTISSSEGSGLVVDGTGSSASLRSCCINDCYSNCLWVCRGAHVDCQSSDICRSRKFHGVAAESSGTTLQLSGCRIYDNYQDGVFVAGGSEVSVDACDIWGSSKFHGISVKRGTSYAKVTRSKIFDNAQTCAYVCEGGRLDFLYSEAWGAATYGLMCTGKGSAIQSIKSHVFDSYLDTVRVICGAAMEVDGGSFQGSKMANSLVVLSAGQCAMKDVCISSSALSGVWVSGSNSKIKMLNNQIHGNELSNVIVDDGGLCIISESKMFGARHGASFVARGKGSRAIISTSLVHSNPMGNYIALSKAELSVDGLVSKRSRSRALWIKDLTSKHPTCDCALQRSM